MPLYVILAYAVWYALVSQPFLTFLFTFVENKVFVTNQMAYLEKMSFIYQAKIYVTNFNFKFILVKS